MSQESAEVYLVLAGVSGEQTFPLDDRSRWTIGREEQSTIQIPGRWISREHAYIERLETGDWHLVDLGSRNGSFVNGRRVTVPAILRDGDEIRFGETLLIFHQKGCPMLADLPADPLRTAPTAVATAVMHVRCLVTVLVVDIRDFTGLAQSVETPVLSRVIGTWFRRSGRAVERHGSRICKYMGDAVMAVWVHREEDQPGEADLLPVLAALIAIVDLTTGLRTEFSLTHRCASAPESTPDSPCWATRAAPATRSTLRSATPSTRPFTSSRRPRKCTRTWCWAPAVTRP